MNEERDYTYLVYAVETEWKDGILASSCIGIINMIIKCLFIIWKRIEQTIV